MKLAERRLARQVRRAVRYKRRRGEITAEQATRLEAGSRDPGVVRRWRTTLEEQSYGAPWVDSDVKTGLNWSNMWSWLMGNWPMILKILLSLLVFLGEKPGESETSDD